MPKTYHTYTVQFKVSVIDWHLAHRENISQTAREFEVDRKRVREWLANADKLRQHCHGRGKRMRRLHPGKAVLCEDLDRAVYAYPEAAHKESSAGLGLQSVGVHQRGGACQIIPCVWNFQRFGWYRG